MTNEEPLPWDVQAYAAITAEVSGTPDNEFRDGYSVTASHNFTGQLILTLRHRGSIVLEVWRDTFPNRTVGYFGVFDTYSDSVDTFNFSPTGGSPGTRAPQDALDTALRRTQTLISRHSERHQKDTKDGH